MRLNAAGKAPALVQTYGSNALQFGELRLPKDNGLFPVAVVIHGGCWTKGFTTLRNTAPLASALAAKGIATWNIEYRQVGDNGAGSTRSWIGAPGSIICACWPRRSRSISRAS
jgi:acetyl esterase/lipase